MEQVGTGPVKDGHEVVADGLDAELGQVADALLVVLDVLVARRQADLDVVVDVDGLDDGGVEAGSMDLSTTSLISASSQISPGILLCRAQTISSTPGICLMSLRVMGHCPHHTSANPFS